MKDIKTIAASYARSFVAAALALYLAGETDPKKLSAAGLAAVLPPLLRWLNPKDASFGVKSEK